MAQGDRRAPVLLGTATSITNPMVAAGAGTTVAVGDLIFGFIVEQTTNTLGAGSDNLGNTYTALGKTTVGGLTYQAYYSRATVAGSLTQFRVAATASGSNSAVVAAVFEGPFRSRRSIRTRPIRRPMSQARLRARSRPRWRRPTRSLSASPAVPAALSGRPRRHLPLSCSRQRRRSPRCGFPIRPLPPPPRPRASSPALRPPPFASAPPPSCW